MLYINDDYEDIILSLTISVMLLSYLGLQILAGGFNFINLRNSQIPEFLINGIYYSFLILCIPIILKRFTIDILGILLFFLVSILISYIFFQNNQVYLEAYSKDIIAIFPAFFITRAIRNPQVFLDYVNKTAYVLFLFGVLYFLFYSMKQVYRSNGYDMVFGYQICLSILILLSKWIKEKKHYDLIFSCLGIMMIIIKGSRGPILVLLAFLMLKFIYSEFAIKTKIKFICFTLLICTLVSIYQHDISVLLLNMLDKFHIYSRTLTYLINNNMDNLSERDLIGSTIIEKIRLNPFGYGVFSDRAILNGKYTHNFILEILLDFGWLIGSLILSGIALLIYSSLKNKLWTDLVIIFVSYIMVELMVSNSYLLVSYFWIMLGVILNAVIQRNGYSFRPPG
ncbi:MAG: O-antigen ligase family protein [Desulfitobacteriaceae bacterium]